MRVTDRQILDTLKFYHGFIAPTADALKVTRQTVYNRIKKSKKLKSALDDILEKRLDLAESKLLTHLKQETDPWLSLAATKYFLSTQGKKRGYYTKVEKEEPEPIPINIIYNTPNIDQK